MSVILHVQSLLFNNTVSEDDRKQWLSDRNYKLKFGNTKSEKRLDDLIVHKQFNSTPDKQQFRVQLDNNVWADCEVDSVKGKRKNTKKPKQESSDEEQPVDNVTENEQ